MKQINSIQAGISAPLGHFYFISCGPAMGGGVTSCPTRKWDSEIGSRRETWGSWRYPKAHQRGQVSSVETVNTLKMKEGFEHWERMWKEQQKKRAGFGAGEEVREEGSEVASLACKCQGSPGAAIWCKPHTKLKSFWVHTMVNSISQKR